MWNYVLLTTGSRIDRQWQGPEGVFVHVRGKESLNIFFSPMESILGLTSWQLLRGATCQEDLSGNVNLVWDGERRGGVW